MSLLPFVLLLYDFPFQLANRQCGFMCHVTFVHCLPICPILCYIYALLPFQFLLLTLQGSPALLLFSPSPCICLFIYNIYLRCIKCPYFYASLISLASTLSLVYSTQHNHGFVQVSVWLLDSVNYWICFHRATLCWQSQYRFHLMHPHIVRGIYPSWKTCLSSYYSWCYLNDFYHL